MLNKILFANKNLKFLCFFQTEFIRQSLIVEPLKIYQLIKNLMAVEKTEVVSTGA